MTLFAMFNMWFGTPSVASCRQVHQTVQSYLDGGLDENSARRVARHLEMCRKCGLEADTYRAIKNSLAAQSKVDSEALQRLRAFGQQLTECDPQ